MEKPNLSGFIIMARAPQDNSWQGLIENSFSMSYSKERVLFLWSSDNASSNLGGKFVVDGRKDAEYQVQERRKEHPDWTFQIYDVHDPELPFDLDWDQWRRDSARSDKTFSGVVNKNGARNVKFQMKEEVYGAV